MPSITSAQQTQVFQIVTGLFNAAPSAAYLTEIDNLVSGGLGGINTQQLAETLANTTAFTTGIMGGKVTVAAQTQQLMSNFGLTYNTGTVGTTTASDFTQTWIAGQLAANVGAGDIVYAAVSALSNSALVAANPAFAGMAATLSNKVAVAEYYSSLPGSASTSLAQMQSVLAGVTASTPVVTTANLAAVVALGTSSSGPSYPLIAGTDHITGAAGGDNFNAVYSDGHAQTLNAGDVLVGGQGVNSLNITSDPANPASATTLGNTLGDAVWAGVSNIQNVNVTTDAGAINIATGSAFNTAFGTAGVALAATTGAGAITIDMGAIPFIGAATITAVSGAGAQNITTGSGLATVTATSNGGAETITGAGLNLVTATTLGAGSQTITSTYAGNVTVNAISAGIGAQTITTSNAGLATITATSALGAQTITTSAVGNAIINATSIIGAQTIATGAGNATITAASYSGPQSITTGAGNDIIVAYSADATGNTITVGAGHGTINLNGTGYTVTVGAAGTNYATAANYVVTGVVGADVITFANDAASSSALTSLGATSIAAIEAAAVALGAHGVAYGTVSGNTYVAEELAAGPASGTNTSLIELLGSRTLTATAGHVTVVGPVVPPTYVYVAGATVYVQTTYPLTTTNGDNLNGGSSNGDVFNGTYSDGGTNTFNANDVLVGGTGLGNTLNISSSMTAAMTLGSGGGDWNAGDSRLTNLNITNSLGAGAITLTSTANFDLAFNTGNLNLTTSAGAGATTITLDGTGGGSSSAFAGTATIVATTGGAGAITVNAGAGVTTVNATTTAGAETINGAGLSSVTLVSNGAGAQTIGNLGGDSVLATINVTQNGNGAQTITSTDASAVTATATMGASSTGGAQTITTGAGNDTITLVDSGGYTVGAVTITGAAGADTIILAATHTGIDTIVYNAVDQGSAAVASNGGALAAGDTVANFHIATDMITVSAVANQLAHTGTTAALAGVWNLATNNVLVDNATTLAAGATATQVSTAIGNVTSTNLTAATGFVAIQTGGATNIWNLYEVDLSATSSHAAGTALVAADTISLVGTITTNGTLTAAMFNV